MSLEDDLRRRAQQLEARQGQLQDVRRPPGWRSASTPEPFKHCADCGDEISPEAVRCLTCEKRRRTPKRDPRPLWQRFGHARGPGGPPNEEETP